MHIPCRNYKLRNQAGGSESGKGNLFSAYKTIDITGVNSPSPIASHRKLLHRGVDWSAVLFEEATVYVQNSHLPLHLKRDGRTSPILPSSTWRGTKIIPISCKSTRK
jgi:hypothetical protein